MTEEKKNPVGAPTIYTKELAIEICDAVSSGYKSLKTLCRQNPHWPGERTIREWNRSNKEFQHMYAKAKDDQSELFVEEILEIADDGTNDYRTNAKGEEVFDSEHVQRSRLRVDSRKWIASKYKPKKYGDIKLPEEKENNDAEIERDRELLHKCKQNE